MGWARKAARRMDLSLCELSEYLEGRPELADVAAVRAAMPIRSESQRRQIARIAVLLRGGAPLDISRRRFADRYRCAAPVRSRDQSR